ncbi:MAG: hypothetical protein M3Y71_07295 [Actinomycetota bacterium]|nr:hypothetical protein [Actinomycetota bacterium]
MPEWKTCCHGPAGISSTVMATTHSLSGERVNRLEASRSADTRHAPIRFRLLANHWHSQPRLAQNPNHAHLPRDLRDTRVPDAVFGLYSTGLMAGQAVGAAIAGLVAIWLTPAHTMSALAVASVAVSSPPRRPNSRSACFSG